MFDDFNLLYFLGSKFTEEFSSIKKLLGRLDVYLLFPMSVFTGFELTFIWTEFSRVILLVEFSVLTFSLFLILLLLNRDL